MSGVNKVILIGRLGADPDMRYLPDGTAVATVSIATSETWKDKKTGEKQEKTEWHRVIFWARLGEIVGEYLRKGSQCYVEGRLQTRKWKDNSEVDRYTTEIRADNMTLLDGKANKMGGNPPISSVNSSANSTGHKMGGNPPISSANGPGANSAPNQANNMPRPDFDEDVPF